MITSHDPQRIINTQRGAEKEPPLKGPVADDITSIEGYTPGPRPETVYEVVVKAPKGQAIIAEHENLRIRIICTIAPDPFDKTFAGLANQSTLDSFTYFTLNEHPKDDVVVARNFEIEAWWAGKEVANLPASFTIVVSTTSSPVTQIPREQFPEGVGPFPLAMERIHPEFLDTAGPMLAQNQKGVAALGAKRVFHSFLFPRPQINPARYNKLDFMRDFVHTMANGIYCGLQIDESSIGQKFRTTSMLGEAASGRSVGDDKIFYSGFLAQSDLPVAATMDHVQSRMPKLLNGQAAWDGANKIHRFIASPTFEKEIREFEKTSGELEFGEDHPQFGRTKKVKTIDGSEVVVSSIRMFHHAPCYPGEPLINVYNGPSLDLHSLPYEMQETNRLIAAARMLRRTPFCEVADANPINVGGFNYRSGEATTLMGYMVRSYAYASVDQVKPGAVAHPGAGTQFTEGQYWEEKTKSGVTNSVLDKTSRAFVAGMHSARAAVKDVTTAQDDPEKIIKIRRNGQEFEIKYTKDANTVAKDSTATFAWPCGFATAVTNRVIELKIGKGTFQVLATSLRHILKATAAECGRPVNRHIDWVSGSLKIASEFRNYPDGAETLLTRCWIRLEGWDKKINERYIPTSLQLDLRPGEPFMIIDRIGNEYIPRNPNVKFREYADAYMEAAKYAREGLRNETHAFVNLAFADGEDFESPGVALLIQNELTKGNVISRYAGFRIAGNRVYKHIRKEQDHRWYEGASFVADPVSGSAFRAQLNMTTFFHRSTLIFVKDGKTQGALNAKAVNSSLFAQSEVACSRIRLPSDQRLLTIEQSEAIMGLKAEDLTVDKLNDRYTLLVDGVRKEYYPHIERAYSTLGSRVVKAPLYIDNDFIETSAKYIEAFKTQTSDSNSIDLSGSNPGKSLEIVKAVFSMSSRDVFNNDLIMDRRIQLSDFFKDDEKALAIIKQAAELCAVLQNASAKEESQLLKVVGEMFQSKNKPDTITRHDAKRILGYSESENDFMDLIERTERFKAYAATSLTKSWVQSASTILGGSVPSGRTINVTQDKNQNEEPASETSNFSEANLRAQVVKFSGLGMRPNTISKEAAFAVLGYSPTQFSFGDLEQRVAHLRTLATTEYSRKWVDAAEAFVSGLTS